MFNLGDYTIIFKATKKLFNIIPVRYKHVLRADVDGLEDTDSVNEIKEVVNEYAKANNIPLLRIPYYNSKIELDKWRELVLNKISEIS